MPARLTAPPPAVGAFLAQVELRQFQIARARDFQIALGAEHNVHVVSQTFDQAGFVGGRESVGRRARKGFAQQRGVEHLRRLRQHHALARNGGSNQRHVAGQAGALHFLDRIQRGNAQYGGASRARFGDHALDLLARHQRAHGVMHQNQLGVARRLGQRVGDRFLPRLASAHDTQGAAEMLSGQARGQRLRLRRRAWRSETR